MEVNKIMNLVEKLDALVDDPFTDHVDPLAVCKEAADVLRSLVSKSNQQVRVTGVRITLKSINKYIKAAGYSERLVKTCSSGTHYQFIDGDSESWVKTNIVTKLSDHSLDQWVGIRNAMSRGE